MPDPAASDPAASAPVVPPYSALAVGYDRVMDYVDYAAWADYVHHVLGEHEDDAGTASILELGCGTGALAAHLQPFGPYRYAGTDGAAAMVAVAQARAASGEIDATFAVADFAEPVPGGPFDAALLLYDGLNYVLDPGALDGVFRAALAAVRPGGLFIVDQSTPANSENHEADFEDDGEVDTPDGPFRYVRRSRYDRATRLHETVFEIDTAAGRVVERHVERAYTMDEVQDAAEAAGWRVEAFYDGFSLDVADDDAERVHWVLRRPA